MTSPITTFVVVDTLMTIVCVGIHNNTSNHFALLFIHGHDLGILISSMKLYVSCNGPCVVLFFFSVAEKYSYGCVSYCNGFGVQYRLSETSVGLWVISGLINSMQQRFAKFLLCNGKVAYYRLPALKL